MTTTRLTRVPGRRPAQPDAVITDAPAGRSIDLVRRQRRYLITMGFRIVCFLAIVFVTASWARLSLVVAAAVLPGIGVLIANAVDRRSHVPQPFPAGMPEDRRALAQDSTHVVSGEVIDN